VTAPAVFVTGGTGYLGSALLPQLTARGHRVRALARGQSVGKLPSGCEPVVGDALDPATFAGAVARGDTFVQLVGTPHPGPTKAREFRRIDLVSVRASVAVAAAAQVSHFVYLSVAQPARASRDTARRLGLVRRREMVAALVEAVERPPAAVRIVEVPEIRGAPDRLSPPLALL
jgi:uncharacterized protein YbjT (DUF2867 family)